MSRYILILILFLGVKTFSQEQVNILNDQDTTNAIQQDSISNQSDSLQQNNSFGIDAVIYATATDSLIFDIKDKGMKIYGAGELKYKKTELKSYEINVDFESSQILAFGAIDSSDTATSKYKQTPILTEGGETYQGNALRYNFKTQKGFISLAKNAKEGNYYAGEKVKKVNKDTYFIQDGLYTTCDADTPHYNFFADKMKVIIKSQIIAKWIFLSIGGVPLPVPLPFGVFPNKAGRRSGIIAPAYGERYDYGQYLSHLGFFWAISDYFDANVLSDIYFKGGYSLKSRIRYNKRYSFNGFLDLGYTDLHQGEKIDPDYRETKAWNFKLDHHQTLTPTARLDASLSFESSDFSQVNSINYNDLLKQTADSRATFNKTFEDWNSSLSLNYERIQYLKTDNNHKAGDFTETLPGLYFSKSQFYPFRSKGKSDPKDQKWFELIGISYNGELLNRRIKDSTDLKVRSGIRHNITSSASQKIGYINFSPNINYSEKWYNKRTETYSIPVIDTLNSTGEQVVYRDSLVTNDISEINMVRNFSLGVSASTKLFGMFQPNILGVEAFRHTLSPTISYSYQPDFSSEKWGYYDSYINAEGQIIRYDKFGREVFAGAGSGERQSINFDIQNVFEIKTKKDPTDTTSEQKKIQLLNLSARSSYNFTADKNKLSDLFIGFRTQISSLLNFDGSAVYSFYDYDAENRKASDKYLSQVNKGILRLRNISLNVSTSLSQSLFQKTKKNVEKEEPELYEPEQNSDYYGIYNDTPPDFSIPWDLRLGLNYSDNYEVVDPTIETARANINASLNFSLTPSTKFSFTGNYDLINKELVAPTIRIYKDLHCWEASLNWNPVGAYRSYRFEIRIKAPQLRDLKVERSRGALSGRY